MVNSHQRGPNYLYFFKFPPKIGLFKMSNVYAWAVSMKTYYHYVCGKKQDLLQLIITAEKAY